MNPFNNENQTEKENSQNTKYNNDTQIGNNYKSTNYLTKKDNDEKDLNTKNLKSNNDNDNDISTININNNIRNIQSPKILINPIYTNYNDNNTSVNNNNNNQYIMPKAYNNFGCKNMVSNPLISNPINNINYNSNPLIQNLNNQIIYSNNNNNNSFYYNINNMSQNNNINNNFNFSPIYRKQNWICSHCTSFNSEGKNYLFNYDFLLI
jgi:hypothetical protein